MFTKLINYRKENNIKMGQMAKKLNISDTFYLLMEKGNRKINYEMAVKIAKVLNTKPDALLFDDQVRKLKEMN